MTIKTNPVTGTKFQHTVISETAYCDGDGESRVYRNAIWTPVSATEDEVKVLGSLADNYDWGGDKMFTEATSALLLAHDYPQTSYRGGIDALMYGEGLV